MEAIQICECHFAPLIAAGIALLLLIMSTWNLIDGLAYEKQYKRNKLKFLTHDDVLILDELLNARYPNENIEKDIARIMINAKKKYEKLEIIREERWKKLWKKDKEQ